MVKLLAKGNTAGRWQSWDLKPRHLAPDPVLLPVLYKIFALFVFFTVVSPGPDPW